MVISNEFRTLYTVQVPCKFKSIVGIWWLWCSVPTENRFVPDLDCSEVASFLKDDFEPGLFWVCLAAMVLREFFMVNADLYRSQFADALLHTTKRGWSWGELVVLIHMVDRIDTNSLPRKLCCIWTIWRKWLILPIVLLQFILFFISRAGHATIFSLRDNVHRLSRQRDKF